ncbi:hypothetical protein AZI86_01435 [Bdellovibrio bacteriovorus]|uniref:Outer membrane protein beta-barrel domain-containing protein n=1 Tax=Bdellovibrio bacteriovorus TaxID=959 RepID=A0A150WN82_BDEBC|nr:hypothetical protein [Bdellovibrio bacteriovorus]KYG65767.1 hypothetical protein AZI86_01435 [Bdellovibrio bacteriovorus]
MNDFKLSFGIMSLIICFWIPKNASAYSIQRGNVSAILGNYVYRTHYQGSDPAISTPYLSGPALTVLGDVSDNGSLEIVTIYMNKLYIREQGGLSVAEKTQAFHITMGYRHWFGSYFSTSLGVYTSYPMGESMIVHDAFPTGQRINTTATEASESGLDWSIQWEAWNNGRWGAVLETKYSYSLTKQSNEWADQYGFNLGVRYFIQGDDTDAAIQEKRKQK